MKITGQPRLHQQRAQRVSLRGIVTASIHLENGRQMTGKIQTLSTTGGLLDLAVYLDERIELALMFRFGPGILQAKAQMLFPMRGGMGYLQPFRFTSIGMKERMTIDTEITAIVKKSVAERIAHGKGFRPPHFYLETF
jgi:hypothetical protein